MDNQDNKKCMKKYPMLKKEEKTFFDFIKTFKWLHTGFHCIVLWQLGEKLHRRKGQGLSELIAGTQWIKKIYEVAFIIFTTFTVLDKHIKVIVNKSVNGW